MALPEGYRKAIRVMEIADRHGFPVLSLIDTPGAYPGVAAEQHGQGGWIARSQLAMSRLARAGGRLRHRRGRFGRRGRNRALGPGADAGERHVLRDLAGRLCDDPLAGRRGGAARPRRRSSRMRVHCLELGVIDAIVPEPPGGAHTDHDAAAQTPRRRARNGARRGLRTTRPEARSGFAGRNSALSACSPPDIPRLGVSTGSTELSPDRFPGLGMTGGGLLTEGSRSGDGRPAAPR